MADKTTVDTTQGPEGFEGPDDVKVWQPKRVTPKQITYATIIAFAAWTFAVYDFILFGTLLPVIGGDLGWDPARQAAVATWVAAGVTVVAAFFVGPVVDKFGRRAGLMFTVGGAGIASALTALTGVMAAIPLLGLIFLVLVRSVAGLGYAEQGVNSAYLSELYSASDNERFKKRRGLVYSLVQSGWPVGALLAAGLTAALLPSIGWRGVFVFAAVPSLIIAVLAYWLRESPRFEIMRRVRHLRESNKSDEAAQLAKAHGVAHDLDKGINYFSAFRGVARRSSIVLTLTHILGWAPVQVFGVLGTTVLISVHDISFQSSLLILLISNLTGFVGYLVHGYFGDRFGRRNVIAVGWVLAAVAFSAMLFAPSDRLTVIVLYSIGMFFLIGPYSCVLFFVGESFPTAVRGTGAAIVVGFGPIGALIASFGATNILNAGDTWQTAALYFGVVPCLLSAIVVLLARNIRDAHSADELETQQEAAQAVPLGP